MRGVADDLHCRCAGARAHHRAEEQGAVHAEHVGAEQEADDYRYQADDKSGNQHLPADRTQAIANAAPGA